MSNGRNGFGREKCYMFQHDKNPELTPLRTAVLAAGGSLPESVGLDQPVEHRANRR